MEERERFTKLWIYYIKTHKDWKELHTPVINAHIKMQREVIKRLSKTPEGRKKIAELYGDTKAGGRRKNSRMKEKR